MDEKRQEEELVLNLKFLSKYNFATLLLTLIIIIAVVLQLNFISQMKQLPSPLYGGDYYAQLGAINHVRYGGSPFVTSNTIDNLPPVYLPVYTWLVAEFANLFNFTSINAMFYFSLIVMVLAIIVAYLLFNEIFKNKYLSLVGVLLFLSLGQFPILKYTELEQVLVIPLFLLLFYRFYNNATHNNAIFAGVLFGVASLTHGTGFIICSAVVFVFAFYQIVIKNYEKGKFRVGDFKSSLKKYVKLYALLFAVGFLVALPYLYGPLFVFRGRIPNYTLMWGTANVLDFSIFVKFLFGILQTTFFNFSTISAAISSVLSVLGILFLFLLKKRNEKTSFISVLMVVNFLLIIHPIFSGPILGVHFVPSYMYGLLTILSLSILDVFALEVAINTFKVSDKKKFLTALFLILFVLLLSSQYLSYQNRLNDRWTQTGETEISPVMAQASEWIKTHTSVNEVILSNNENAFALNALTGRKTLLNRRTHMSMFLDADSNMMDGAIILYGNDSEKRSQLLKDRKVKYLYWDTNWMGLEYTIQDGKIVGVFDPITLIYSPAREAELMQYNISYSKQYTWLDPAAKEPDIIQMDIMYVFPYIWNDTAPWNPDLNSHLTEVWNFKDQNNVSVAKIFEVN